MLVIHGQYISNYYSPRAPWPWTLIFVSVLALRVPHKSAVQAVLIYTVKRRYLQRFFPLTCCWEGAGSEGKLWDERLRGGGWGGSRLCGALAWDGCGATGIRGSCILSTGVLGWAGPAAWGFSGSGSNGEPGSTFAVIFMVRNCNES